MPHITILDYDGNDSGGPDFNLDRWFLETRRSGFWGWAGRNGAPLWKLNELFWDDDATPAGLAAASWRRRPTSGREAGPLGRLPSCDVQGHPGTLLGAWQRSALEPSIHARQQLLRANVPLSPGHPSFKPARSAFHHSASFDL